MKKNKGQSRTEATMVLFKHCVTQCHCSELKMEDMEVRDSSVKLVEEQKTKTQSIFNF